MWGQSQDLDISQPEPKTRHLYVAASSKQPFIYWVNESWLNQAILSCLLLQVPAWGHCFHAFLHITEGHRINIVCTLKWCWFGTTPYLWPTLIHLWHRTDSIHARARQLWASTAIRESKEGADSGQTLPQELLCASPCWGLYVSCVFRSAALWLDSIRTFHHSILVFSYGLQTTKAWALLTPHRVQQPATCLPLLPQWPESDTAHLLWGRGKWSTLSMLTIAIMVLELKKKFILYHHIIWMSLPDNFPMWLS